MEQSAQKQKGDRFFRCPKKLTIIYFFCFFNLWGREATAQLGSAGNQKQSAAEQSRVSSHKGSRCQFWTGSARLLCKKEVRDTLDWAQTLQRSGLRSDSCMVARKRNATNASNTRTELLKNKGEEFYLQTCGSDAWSAAEHKVLFAPTVAEKDQRGERPQGAVVSCSIRTQHRQPSQTLKIHKCGSRSRSSVM